MNPIDEFSARPLRRGYVHGIRSFRVAEWTHRIRSPWREFEFKPGMNEAFCEPVEVSILPDSLLRMLRRLGGFIDAPHRTASIGCTCGFYSYFSADFVGPYAPPQRRVDGIVRGHGLTTVGAKGFRSERIEILALIRVPGQLSDEAVQRVTEQYPAIWFDTADEACEAFELTLPEEMAS